MKISLESTIVEHLVSDSVGEVEDIYAYVHSCLGKENRINDFFLAQIDGLDFDRIEAKVRELIPAADVSQTILTKN